MGKRCQSSVEIYLDFFILLNMTTDDPENAFTQIYYSYQNQRAKSLVVCVVILALPAEISRRQNGGHAEIFHRVPHHYYLFIYFSDHISSIEQNATYVLIGLNHLMCIHFH